MVCKHVLKFVEEEEEEEDVNEQAESLASREAK